MLFISISQAQHSPFLLFDKPNKFVVFEVVESVEIV